MYIGVMYIGVIITCKYVVHRMYVYLRNKTETLKFDSNKNITRKG